MAERPERVRMPWDVNHHGGTCNVGVGVGNSNGPLDAATAAMILMSCTEIAKAALDPHVKRHQAASSGIGDIDDDIGKYLFFLKAVTHSAAPSCEELVRATIARAADAVLPEWIRLARRRHADVPALRRAFLERSVDLRGHSEYADTILLHTGKRGVLEVLGSMWTERVELPVRMWQMVVDRPGGAVAALPDELHDKVSDSMGAL